MRAANAVLHGCFLPWTLRATVYARRERPQAGRLSEANTMKQEGLCRREGQHRLMPTRVEALRFGSGGQFATLCVTLIERQARRCGLRKRRYRDNGLRGRNADHVALDLRVSRLQLSHISSRRRLNCN